MTTALPPNPQGYAAPIWMHFCAPTHAGTVADDALRVRVGTRAARGVLELSAIAAQGRVVQARFRAYGCPTTIAVGDWLAGWCERRSAVELLALTAAQVREALEIPESRAHCGLMGEDAARALGARLQGEPR